MVRAACHHGAWLDKLLNERLCGVMPSKPCSLASDKSCRRKLWLLSRGPRASLTLRKADKTLT